MPDTTHSDVNDANLIEEMSSDVEVFGQVIANIQRLSAMTQKTIEYTDIRHTRTRLLLKEADTPLEKARSNSTDVNQRLCRLGLGHMRNGNMIPIWRSDQSEVTEPSSTD